MLLYFKYPPVCVVRILSDNTLFFSDNNIERNDTFMSDSKKPRAAENKSSDGTKIYYPHNIVAPMWETNVITDNYTDEDGNVYNKSDQNVLMAKTWVDDNRK